jgi:hypothetical protein
MHPARYILLASAIVLTSTAPWKPIHAAGQRTHVEIGRRALDKYFGQVEEMLPGLKDVFLAPEALSAYYAGCMFPDWAFPNINNAASEDAHWKRYQEPYFQYLTEKCPLPWDDEEKRRIAFFMGIVCHGMADLPWHFGKEGHASLLERSWANDRASHFDTEYSYDLFLYQDGTSPKELMPKLWWPIPDIKAVYRKMGTILPDGQLENMFVRTNVMINSGTFAASMTADGLRKKYPWVNKTVEGYYFGGMENGGALTASWLKYYYARMIGGRYYQNLPTAEAEDKDERIYAGTTDATIIEKLPKNNAGNEPYLDLSGDRPGDSRSSLVRFDVSDWPKGKPIRRATLWLYFVGWQGTPPTAEKRIDLYPLRNTWQEGIGTTSDVTGTDGQPHDDGSVTWSNQATQALASPSSSRTVSADEEANHWLSWDVTSLVQEWQNDSARNHGVILSSPSAGPGIVRVYSSEAFRTQPEVEDKGGGFRIVYRPTLILLP